MNKPEMIIFDYGHTLLYEPDVDFLRGERELFRYISRNPKRVSAAYAFQFGSRLFKKTEKCRRLGFELHEYQLLRLKYEYLGIRFSKNWDEIEKILWDFSSPGAVMPHAAEMLAFLAGKGIRTGVISNIGWSGKALAERIEGLLPGSGFEFVIASSEYAVRKPDKLLFEIALGRAKLPPEKVWYCGDSLDHDVYGAHNAGIFPVLYRCEELPDPKLEKSEMGEPDFEYLRINDWRELTELSVFAE